MEYQLGLARSAAKALERINDPHRRLITDRLRQLAATPDDPRFSIQLTGHKTRRSRVGDWRILYNVDHVERSVTILEILPRGNAYRNF